MGVHGPLAPRGEELDSKRLGGLALGAKRDLHARAAELQDADGVRRGGAERPRGVVRGDPRVQTLAFAREDHRVALPESKRAPTQRLAAGGQHPLGAIGRDRAQPRGGVEQGGRRRERVRGNERCGVLEERLEGGARGDRVVREGAQAGLDAKDASLAAHARHPDRGDVQGVDVHARALRAGVDDDDVRRGGGAVDEPEPRQREQRREGEEREPPSERGGALGPGPAAFRHPRRDARAPRVLPEARQRRPAPADAPELRLRDGAREPGRGRRPQRAARAPGTHHRSRPRAGPRLPARFAICERRVYAARPPHALQHDPDHLVDRVREIRAFTCNRDAGETPLRGTRPVVPILSSVHLLLSLPSPAPLSVEFSPRG